MPTQCSTCHSGPGFLDFVGADGTAKNLVDHPAPIGSPIGCVACHNSAASALGSVTFPSGEIISNLGSSAVCSVCHQGRASGDQLNATVAELGEDVVSSDLSFLNVHYRAAAATLMGGSVRGGYQYDGEIYEQRFAHVPPLNNCAGCHNPHSLKVSLTDCVGCHQNADNLRAIRLGSADVDGDGNTSEGVADEIATLHSQLNSAIEMYAAEVSGVAIVYAPASYPYFFIDTDGDGVASAAEAIYPNSYKSWTPRLLKAAYNYQFIAKDPGAYAHNPRYVVQLLIDSLEDLSTKIDTDISSLIRP
ncbi:MAG: polyheme membrane-associated cytochrome C [Rhizobiales bacterium]|nr:polyheme membrane-associated cytochrome C [Hyphomicrobiales bacterium]